MSVANDYPVSAWLRQGARSVQNVPLVHADGTPTSVMKLLRAGTRCLGLWLHPDPDLAAQAAERLRGLPIDLYAIGDGCALPGLRDEAGVLARHLGAPPSGAAGSFFLVRPDAYLAASVSNATPDAIHSALQTTLGLVNESIGAPA